MDFPVELGNHLKAERLTDLADRATVPSGSRVSRMSFLSDPMTTDSCSFTRYTCGVQTLSL
jgi:hypothetical protein